MKKSTLRFITKYIMYLIRWQLSTIILAPVIAYYKHSNAIFGTSSDWYSAIVANLIGGIIFFWVDGKIIFNSPIFKKELWEIKNNIKCVDCGCVARGYRLILKDKYDKTNDKNVEFRCETCSQKKYKKQFSKDDI